MAEIVLKAAQRTEFGKGAARRTRRAGLVPAVMHDRSESPIHISLPGHDAYLALRHVNAVLTIELDGEQTLTIAREIQRDALKDTLQHIDLQIVKRGEKIEASVPLHIAGEPTTGLAILDSQELHVRAEATNVPEVISISVDGLNEGETVRIADLQLPEGVEAVDHPDTNVVTITSPQGEEPALTPETEATQAFSEE
ncbi:MAG: 50S ribosomal protein L25/general stress protein Ctc [Bifidobacteriaceae bacterium]|jgi:large subunit ribosomal protein L25|nr:50S ribosomal protein L25/general stress protein Ctc [Bifidobacteriaceae bacterium]